MALSCLLSVALIAIGGKLVGNGGASFFSFEVLFGHGLFVLLVFPTYCVLFYWVTYPVFRVLPSQSGGQEHFSAAGRAVSGISSAVSILFSSVGFLIPPFALVGIIVGHLTRIQLGALGSFKKGRLALVGLVLGHLSLGLWVTIFVVGFVWWSR